MEFIASLDPSDEAGEDAEQEVWEGLKQALGPDDTGIAYYKYPVIDKTSGQFDQEPDFVLFHQDLGLLVIECKGYQIGHIDRIDGYTWHLQGMSQNQSTPLGQARQQAMHLRSYFNRGDTSLVNEYGEVVVPSNQFVALPNITRREWEARGFHELPSTPKVITADELSPKALRRRLNDISIRRSLTDEEYADGRSILSGGHAITDDYTPAVTSTATKGALYERVQKGLRGLDQKQEAIGIQIPPGPQQIRGIAGSGKTVLIAMKAARMHLRHPEWDIAITFFTKTLYQHLTELVETFYWQFAESEPNWDKIHLVHGWGGKTTLPGMYYNLCLKVGRKHRTPFDAKEISDGGSPPELLDACCEELLETETIPQLYDAILIDEAQDFDKYFYRLCRAALKPPKRLIWAYDEAQDLSSLSIPEPTKIFGTDDNGDAVVDLRGTYEGGIQKSQIMRQAYRTPRSVLMTAHVFGMGLKRDGDAIQAITNKNGWQNIGYKVLSGDFRKVGQPIELTRPLEYSPHPLNDQQEARPFVQFEEHDTRKAEREWIATQIRKDIDERGLEPHEILVVPIGDSIRTEGAEIADVLEDHDVDVHCVWKDSAKSSTEHKGTSFTNPGNVTIAGVNRAKGNEAAMVYVTHIDNVANDDRRGTITQRRNEAFVAITRTRGWCTITGSDSPTLFDELEEIVTTVSQTDPVVTFPAPNPQTLERELESSTETTLFDWTDPDAIESESRYS